MDRGGGDRGAREGGGGGKRETSVGVDGVGAEGGVGYVRLVVCSKHHFDTTQTSTWPPVTNVNTYTFTVPLHA